MKNKSKYLKLYNVLSIVTVCLFFVILFTYALNITYSSDDYGYSLFLDNGISGWIKKMEEHYQYGNGRTFVHLLATAILHFNNLVFAVVFIINIAVISYCFRSKNTDRISFLILFLGGWILMPRPIAVEGVLWVSGFCNYVFPVAMTALLFYQSRKALNQNSYNWKTIILLLILSFLTGATTEQNGIAASIVLVIIFVEALVNRNSVYAKICFVQILLAVIGVISIFLSPATQLRAADEMYAPMLKRITDSLIVHKDILFENYMFVLLVAAFPVLLLKNIGREKGRGFLVSLSWLIELCLILAKITDGVISGCFYGIFMILMLLFAGACWVSGYKEIGSVLCFGLMTAFVILPTESSGYRILYPMYVVFLLLVCELFCNIPSGLIAKKDKLTKLLVVVVSICAMITAICDFPHYYNNHKTELINAKYAKQAKSSGIVYYCMDYDRKYTHTKAFESVYFYTKYLETLRLSSPPKHIYFYSEKLPVVYANNVRLTSPGIESIYGELMVSLREVIESLGGTLKLTRNQEIEILFNDKTYLLSGGSGNFYLSWQDDEQVEHNINMLTSTMYGYYKTLIPIGFYQDILGLNVDISDKEVRINSQFD